MADAQDLKSWDLKKSCGFESHHRYHCVTRLMSKLQPPDTHHLSAAEGWFELGNYAEALAELDRISEAEQGRLEVLGLRWNISAQIKLWDECVGIAGAIVELAPKAVFGWIHRSYALHELKRTREARDLLLPALKKFPKNETIPYNLACYECQSGNLAEARRWLLQAMKLRKPAAVKAQALADPDLKPLWAEIEKMPVSAKGFGSNA
jgi:tetratricopeptide (TPR) repeat protein